MFRIPDAHSPPATRKPIAWRLALMTGAIALSTLAFQPGCGDSDPPSGTVGCENGKTRAITCPAGTEAGIETCTDGAWVESQACTPTEGCKDGATRDISCPTGTEGGVDTCTNGAWTESTACTPVQTVDCEDGNNAIVCGINGEGTQTEVCEGGKVVDPGTCDDPDVCENGKTQNDACGTNGLVPQSCVDGQWDDTGACEEFCVDDTTDTVSCGINGDGEQSLKCVDGEWENDGACVDTDVCLNNDEKKTECATGGDFAHIEQRCTGGQWTGSTCKANSISLYEPNGCAVRNSGHVMCWGANSKGELGIGNATAQSKPVNVKSISNAKEVVVGSRFACALTTTGDVYCWGSNYAGQLGNGSTEDKHLPTKAAALANVKQLTAGHNHACALLADNTVYCWGKNSEGQLGIGTLMDQLSPTKIPSLSGVREIYAGENSTCARMPAQIEVGIGPHAGDVWCWGDNENRGAGVQSSVTVLKSPTKVAGRTFIDVAIARGFFCGLQFYGMITDQKYAISCIGIRGPHQGDANGATNYTDFNTAEFEYSGRSPVVVIRAGGGLRPNMCALSTSEGRLDCWGRNDGSSLGRRHSDMTDVADLATPFPLSSYTNVNLGLPGNPPMWVWVSEPITGILAFDVAEAAVCAIDNKGKISCTGRHASSSDRTLSPLADVPAAP